MGGGSVDTVLASGEIVLRVPPSARVDELEISRAATASVAARVGRLRNDPGPGWPVVAGKR